MQLLPQCMCACACECVYYSIVLCTQYHTNRVTTVYNVEDAIDWIFLMVVDLTFQMLKAR